jgi:dienelactone hydrolase
MPAGQPLNTSTGSTWHGPNPTPASVGGELGPYPFQMTSVPGDGFGAGTIYYPTTTTEGTFAAVVITPGMTVQGWAVSWYAGTLASQGFVAMTIDTFSTSDLPDQRTPQVLAAVDYLTHRSPVHNRIDPNRVGVMGHSAGGGGSVNAAQHQPSIKAEILLDPVVGDDPTAPHYHSITVPTMIFVGQTDQWLYESNALYADLPATTHKAYAELAGGDHNQVLHYSADLATQAVSWFKRFLDNDTRYARFLCPVAASSSFSAHQGTCPV